MSNAPLSVREYYNATAANWADRWYADESMLPLLQVFMDILPSCPRVLDLCCGTGCESKRLAQLGAEVVGIDLSEESIRIARERNPQLSFHLGDMLKGYTHLGMFDGLICIAGLVHLTDAQLPVAFAQMALVLKPGAPVLLVVRDGEGRLSRQSDVVVDGVAYDRAFYAHTLESLRQIAADFCFVREIPDAEPSPWRNYIFQRK